MTTQFGGGSPEVVVAVRDVDVFVITASIWHVTGTSSPGVEHGRFDVEPNSIYRWVKRAGERRYAATGDEGWTYLDVHDLRRTWGGHLLWDCGVLPAVVISWGGWDDWETFRNHYLGEMSPAAAEREREKFSFVSGDLESEEGPFF